MPKRLLVVDDDPAIRRTLSKALEGDELRVGLAANAAEGLTLYQRDAPDLVLLDLFLPDQHGLEVLKQLREKDPEAAIIVVTASDDVRDAVEAMKLGALEYVVKPYELETLKVFVRRALDLKRRNIELDVHKRAQAERYTFSSLSSANARFAEMIALAQKLAQNATMTLLIEGETGVGKEFLARAIHLAGPRAGGPFVPISCAAIPETLLESELFGHEAGAYTDARGRKRGLFELAEGGTLFLDEIGEMSIGMQAKLLRAIETLVFRRLGGTEDLQVDARVMAATNVAMERAVEAKKFREDLYYRLKVGRLNLMPLRERPEDILGLAEKLLRDNCREVGRRPLELSEEVRQAFLRYAWPGNVRELKNVLERAVILCEDEGPVSLAHLPHELSEPRGADGPAPARQTVSVRLADAEKQHILRVLESVKGNHTRAAKALGISRTTLWEKLKSYRLADGE